MKQGPQVREGLLVQKVEEFIYDHTLLGSTASRTQQGPLSSLYLWLFSAPAFSAPVRSLTSGPLCSPSKLTMSWWTRQQLESWLDISGRRIGLCDWRPEKSGSFGRFVTESIKEF